MTQLFFALITGLILGVIFFGGLWITVRKGTTARYPAVWFGVSMLVRTGIVLLGFYLAMQGELLNLVLCLVGFIVARIGVMKWTKAQDQRILSTKETGHGH